MFQRLINVFKGIFAMFVKDVEKRNPEALLELEQENLRKQIAQYNQGLAGHAGLAERLMSQVRKLESEEAELRAKGFPAQASSLGGSPAQWWLDVRLSANADRAAVAAFGPSRPVACNSLR